MTIKEVRIKWGKQKKIPEITTNLANTPQSAREILKKLGCEGPEETFVVLYLNSKNHPCGFASWTGTLDQTAIYPRAILQRALLCNAAALVLGHNHPSGDPFPSTADKKLTSELKQISGHLGIAIHDHIILGDNGRYYSLRENGLITGS